MPFNVLSRRRLVFSALLAGGALTAPRAFAAADPAVLAPIQQLNDELLAMMKAAGSTTFEQRFAMLAPAVEAAFDLPLILQRSVGAAWSSLPAQQRQDLQASFRRYTIASYVNSFDSYNGQRFVVSPDTRSAGAGEQVVQTRIIPQSGDGHQIDYVMQQIDGAWKAVDVLADGSISRVAVQRSDFRRLLANGGAPALMAQLQRKVSDLSRG